MVWVFIIEKDEKTNQQDSITGTYLKLFQIIKLPAVKQFVVILLTVKVKVIFTIGTFNVLLFRFFCFFFFFFLFQMSSEFFKCLQLCI